MTWYRCGGGGIPSSLKTDMNAVLNKKFGTSADYPPADWAPTVNLMGPLPEGTATGSIAHITDGADEVPIKSWQVEIAPTLTEKSAIECTQTGKNLLDTAISETKSHNSVSITCDGNGKYTATGTATGGSANITFTLKTPCTIKSGMYLHLMNSGASGSVSITLQKQDNTTIYAPALSPANRIADLSSYAGQTIYSIRFYIANGASFEMTLTPMACFSSTATAYEPYQTPTQYTAQLGRTIYGGTADVVKGEGQETYKKVVLDGSLNWAEQSVGNIDARYYIGGITYDAENLDTTGVSNMGALVTSFTSDGITVQSNGRVSLCGSLHSQYASVDDLKNALNLNPLVVVYKLATPTDFTFTPITPTPETALGVNNFWSDSGDTEVTYRADINLALGGQ